jgi:hypothetical protein
MPRVTLDDAAAPTVATDPVLAIVEVDELVLSHKRAVADCVTRYVLHPHDEVVVESGGGGREQRRAQHREGCGQRQLAHGDPPRESGDDAGWAERTSQATDAKVDRC